MGNDFDSQLPVDTAPTTSSVKKDHAQNIQDNAKYLKGEQEFELLPIILIA